MAEIDDILRDKRRPAAERVRALSRLSSAEGHKGVWDVVHDETDDVEVRIAAVKAIGRSRGAVNQLARRFYPPEVRAAAVAELERIAQQPPDPGMESFFSIYQQMLGTEQAAGLFNLAGTYGRDRRVIDAARRASMDARPELRAGGLGALAQIGEIDDVLGGTTDQDPRVRAAAAYGIGFFSLRRDKDVAALERLTKDADADVRAKAKAGLRRLGLASVSARHRRTPPKGDPVWIDLLEKLSAKVLADRELAADLPDEALRTGWLGSAGATIQQLRDAESRLGRRLPRSYGGFLETSNGWYTTSFFCLRLLPVDEILPFIESDPQWIEAYGESDLAAALRTAIQVSSITDNGVCLLIPSEAAEWETWWFANWIPGAHRHSTFYDFMQGELAR